MKLALRLAARARGFTSPNPLVGAVLVHHGQIIGRGWHHRAGEPHAEICAIQDARRRSHRTRGATLYVTLEPCSTRGRTPPCTEAIQAAGIRRVIVAATDSNPRHRGRGFRLLREAGVEVESGLLEDRANSLNAAFNHWIIRGTPEVTVKAAMSLDGRIASNSGQSKWITGKQARAWAMNLRLSADAMLVGVNTILADDPLLTWRPADRHASAGDKRLRRIILDALARTPLDSKVVSDPSSHLTTIFVSSKAPRARIDALAKHVQVVVAPLAIAGAVRPSRSGPGRSIRLDLPWILKTLGSWEVTELLVEGGGEVNASFLLQGLAHRVAFFYAPILLGGGRAPRGVAGEGAVNLSDAAWLRRMRWRRLGSDLLLTAEVSSV